MFFEDAVGGRPLLGLVLTARHKDSDVEAPMCGVPHHASTPTSPRLVAAGKKVAIGEQTEAPAKGRTLVARRIVRVVTPGTIVDPDRLDARQANEMAAVPWNGDGVALAYLDLSTGDFAAIRLDRAAPAELPAAPACPASCLLPVGPGPVERLARWRPPGSSRRPLGAPFRVSPRARGGRDS